MPFDLRTQRLPTGTLTFVFTDIEGSTRLLQALGSEFRSVLERHNEILRSAWREHSGTEVKTDGDAFFVVFTDPAAAVRAVAEGQRGLAAETWPAGQSVRVRMGMHTGQAIIGGDDYLGLDVHRAARIAAAGHGGQVLLSETTRRLVERSMPEGVGLVDLGQHRLKDIDVPERLAQLAIDKLGSDFPPIRSLDARPTNLPPAEGKLLGRDRELERVREFVRRGRLVTLTGAGGTGKSSLALAVAESLRGDFEDGVFVTWLAPIRDRALLPGAIAAPLGVQESGGRTAAELLPEYLRSRQLLVVLDNFEQLVGAAGYLAQLLDAAPGLHLLVTSQVTLRLRAEQMFEVPPLPVPAAGSSPGEIRSNPAVALFESRVRAVRPDFQLTDDNVNTVLEIVERLDGLPLAIELAAARLRVLTPAAVLSRLDRRLAILVGGGADRPARHQTLRATLDWSHDLLEPAARRLLAGLSVFRGGFDLATAEAVFASGPAPAATVDVTDELENLVEHSLIRIDEGGGEPRFAMLESIREYAAERLAESGDADVVRARHAAAFVDVAERHVPLILGAAGARHLDRLDRDHDNLRAALQWALDGGAAEAALRMTAALWRFWQLRGHLDEGRQWTEAALTMPGRRLEARRSAALIAKGGLLYWQADMTQSTASYVDALTMARLADDDARLVEALANLGMMVAAAGRTTDAANLSAEGMRRAQTSGDQRAVALLVFGDAYRTALEGRLDESYAMFERGLAMFQEVGDVYWEATSLHGLGQCRRLAGAAAEAEPLYREALIRLDGLGDRAGVAVELDLLAVTAIMLGDPVRGVRLAGAAMALRELLGAGQLLAVQVYQPPTELAAGTLDEQVVTEALAEGRSWSLRAAVAYALGPEGALSAEPRRRH